MRKIFNRKNNNNSLDSIIGGDIKNYLSYMKDIYFLSGTKLYEDEKEKLSDEYQVALDYFKKYLEKTFNDNSFKERNSININEDEMVEGAPSCAKNLFCKHPYSSIIYLNDSNSYPHIHTDGNNVTGIEGLQSMKGLKKELIRINFDKVFEGLTVEEAAALLEQMNLLDIEGELRREIAIHRIWNSIRQLFFRDIVLNVLDSESPERVTRARLFADTFGVDFSFEVYEYKLEKQKDLLLTKKDC